MGITEPHKLDRLRGSFSLSHIPFVVVGIAAVSGWVVVEYGGYAGGNLAEGRLALIDPTVYIVSLLLHESWSAYVGSMYFFLPAGVLLTYMTTNRSVLGVVVVSHVSTVLLTGLSFDMTFAGTTAAAYGLLAANITRATRIGTEKYSERTQRGAPLGTLVIATLGLFMLTTTSDFALRYTPLLIGFVFGGAFEASRVLIETRTVTESEDERSLRYTN